MGEGSIRRCEVRINPEAPLFVISVVSEVVHIPVWTLRRLDEMGIVRPRRLGKKTRCYSYRQLEVLSYIRYLMEERQVNLNGIRVILEAEMEKDALRRASVSFLNGLTR